MSYTAIGIIIFYMICVVILIILCTTTKKNPPKLPRATITPPRPKERTCIPPSFCKPYFMPPVKPPLVKTDTVVLERGTATYDQDFGYIILTLNNPIHFAKQEVYVSKHELDKILKELKT